MSSIASGPFAIFCNTLESCTAVTNLPDWAQAGSIVIVVTVVALGVLVASLLFAGLASVVPGVGWVFSIREWEVRAALYMFGFAPPVAGVVAGGISLVYGIQDATPGYMIGGAAVLAISLIVLLVLLSKNTLPFWFAITGAVIGLYLGYYGYAYAVQGVEMGGG